MGDVTPLTTLLDFAKFGISPITGFCSQREPLQRLPASYDAWEDALASASQQKLRLATVKGLSAEEKAKSEAWRARIRQLPVLSIEEAKASLPTLNRAHHVLSYLVHFYVHTLPTDAELVIPAPIALPLLRVAAELGRPPVMAYSDDILNNWKLKDPALAKDGVPTVDNMTMQTSFTGRLDEEFFYLAASKVEVRGGEALRIAQEVLEKILDGSAVQADVTASLQRMAPIIKELRGLALSVKDGCQPDFFYRELRPWLLGGDSDPNGRKWIFEGIETDPTLKEPTELSGSSAAQSPLIQALDIFFGTNEARHQASDKSAENATAKGGAGSSGLSSSFAKRMRIYMPYTQRDFLEAFTAYSHVLRGFVEKSGDAALMEAYNQAVLALKEFRDGHMIIITLFVIQPARRLAREEAEAEGKVPGQAEAEKEKELKGSAGGDLTKLLKDFRDKTTRAVLQ